MGKINQPIKISAQHSPHILQSEEKEINLPFVFPKFGQQFKAVAIFILLNKAVLRPNNIDWLCAHVHTLWHLALGLLGPQSTTRDPKDTIVA